jgi:hypothetical protein
VHDLLASLDGGFRSGDCARVAGLELVEPLRYLSFPCSLRVSIGRSVRLDRDERGRITPKVIYDRVELDVPLVLSRKAG